MLIIGLIGKGGSGKGTAASYLSEKFKAKPYRFSKALDDILKRIHQPNSRENEASLALVLRKLYGNDVLAQVLKNDIIKDNSKVAVVDGIRYPEEIALLKTLPSFKLAAIKTNKNTRYERMLKRGEKAGETKLSKDEFETHEKKETEQYISELTKQADSIINNNGSLEDLKNNLDRIVNDWKK